MSSDRPSGGPSPPPEPDAEPGRAATVAALGAPLVEALEQHLPGARRHAEATAAYAFAAALELGRDTESAELVREAAKLHDVGLVYVPAAVLRKSAAERDEAERALVGSQIEAGHRLALGAGIPDEVCGWLLRTRERWAGGGPEGLAGEAIPPAARLIRVACAADLMLTSSGREPTVAGLRAAAGDELDPGAVEAMVAVLERATPGWPLTASGAPKT